MRRTAITVSGAALVALCGGLASTLPTASADTTTPERQLLVLAKDGVSDSAARAAIARAGGTVSSANVAIGLYDVSTKAGAFSADAMGSGAIQGVARDRVIGRSPDAAAARAKNKDVEKALTDRAVGNTKGVPKPAVPTSGEPLAGYQWDMRMIRTEAAHQIATGRGARVGVMDTGVDADHPDLRANVNRELSRNFTVDMPDIDGPCEDEPDKSCNDPATVDEGGHGTHVAGTIAAAVNGRGMAGVAPNAEIVNLRVGQDSGYFFLKPTVDALTYAADTGIDVVNMSYYIDPWLYNCANNPADSPEAQAQQQTIIAATNRALKYAFSRGIALIAAAGNQNTDLNNPTFDGSSPDYPEDAAYDRTIDNSCVSLPTEGTNVMSISSVGPSKLKADYSSYGTEQVTVAAPGGYFRDFYGTPQYGQYQNLILSTVPKNVLLADGLIDPATGAPKTAAVIRDCTGGECAYYQYLQGTSMAAPHATGVAALIVSRWGHPAPKTGGLDLAPKQTQKILEKTAVPTPCPAPVYDYPDRPDAYTAKCEGTTEFNGWYGHGIVDALNAVTSRK